MNTRPYDSSGRSSRSFPHFIESRRVHLLRCCTFGRHNPNFVTAYKVWEPVREKSISELEKLSATVSDEQKNIDAVKLCSKYGCQFGRGMKQSNRSGSIEESFGMLATFVGEVAGGLATLTEAVKTDNSLSTFKEILKRDNEVTRKFYTARSECVSTYLNVTEVVRDCNVSTFSETCSSISDTLEIYNDCKDPSLASLGHRFDEQCTIATINEVVEPIRKYQKVNPAAVDVVSSVGRCIYGAADAFGDSSKSSGITRCGKRLLDSHLLQSDLEEIHHLQDKIRHGSESEVGKLISEALDRLKSEKQEMDSMIDEIIEEE